MVKVGGEFQGESVACTWVVTGTGSLKTSLDGKEGGSLVLGAMDGHSADEGLDSSMVTGAHLGSRRKAIGRCRQM